MRLQMSLDRVNTATALEILKDTHDVIDIVEVGTPFILREGMHAVAAIHEKYPDVVILADTKIMDGGEYASGMAFEAGAKIATVLGVSEDATIKNDIKSAKAHGTEILVDMIAVHNIIERAQEVDEWGADYIGIHTGFDLQALGETPLSQLKELNTVIKNARPAVAGGIDLNTLPEIVKEKPEIIICGKSITRSASPRETILKMKEIMGN